MIEALIDKATGDVLEAREPGYRWGRKELDAEALEVMALDDPDLDKAINPAGRTTFKGLGIVGRRVPPRSIAKPYAQRRRVMKTDNDGNEWEKWEIVNRSALKVPRDKIQSKAEIKRRDCQPATTLLPMSKDVVIGPVPGKDRPEFTTYRKKITAYVKTRR